jgi:hypothetical protein
MTMKFRKITAKNITKHSKTTASAKESSNIDHTLNCLISKILFLIGDA